jgi:hypothetical protein
VDADSATPVVGNQRRGAENVVGEAGGSDPAGEEGSAVRPGWGGWIGRHLRSCAWRKWGRCAGEIGSGFAIFK